MIESKEKSQIERLIEFLEFTSENMAVVAEAIRTSYKTHSFIRLDISVIMDEIQEYCRQIRDRARKLKTVPYLCYRCRHRHSLDWYAQMDFCEYYPSFSERKEMKGLRCSYFEEG